MNTITLLLNALFPRTCVQCEQEGAVLCDGCKKQVHLPSWHTEEKEGITVYTRVSYKERAVQRLLHAWKYRGDAQAGEIWKEWMGASVLPITLPANTMCIPVPLAREAYAERGFNQAEVLAHALAAAHGFSVLCVLDRLPRAAQAKTKKEDRGDVRVHNPYGIRGEARNSTAPTHVVLVDDVITTGSTMAACADVLRAWGVKEITYCTLAYGNNA